MTTLLELREKVLSVYSQYEKQLDMAAGFLVTLLALVVINGQVGYQETLAGILPTLIIALLGAVCPPGFMVVILGLVILLHLYSLALEAAAIGGVLFLVVLLIYLRFTPGDTILLLLYPFCRAIGMQYALPIAGGLLFTPASGITVAVGVVVDGFLRFVHQNEAAIRSTAESESTDGAVSRLQFLMDGIMQDKTMMIMAIAVAAAAAVVYVVRRLPIPYAWIMASGIGGLLQLMIVLGGALLQNTSVHAAATLAGALGGFAAGAVLSFLLFNLDYSRMESTQFEDDEYYYYVKAVPKNAIASPRRTVRTINARRGSQGHAQRPPAEMRSGGRDDRMPHWEEPVYEEPDYEDISQDGYGDEFGEDF